jgi:hypothetical protein
MPAFHRGVLLGVLPTGDTGLPCVAATVGAVEADHPIEELHAADLAFLWRFLAAAHGL